jgi:hypothetical protein
MNNNNSNNGKKTDSDLIGNEKDQNKKLTVTFIDFSEAEKDYQYYTMDFVRLNLSVINTWNQVCILSNVYAMTSDGDISYFYPEFPQAWGKTVGNYYLVSPNSESIYLFDDRPGIGTTMDLNKEIIETGYNEKWVSMSLPNYILIKIIEGDYSNHNLPGTFEISLEINNQNNKDIYLENFGIVTNKNNCYDLGNVVARNTKTITKTLITDHNSASYPYIVEEPEMIVFYAGFPYYSWYSFEC